MSYSVRVENIDREVPLDVLAVLLSDQAADIPDGDGTPQAEIQDHMRVAAAAAVELLKEVGQVGDVVNVSVSGHADPGHVQRAEWSPEFCNIGVTVLRHAVDPT